MLQRSPEYQRWQAGACCNRRNGSDPTAEFANPATGPLSHPASNKSSVEHPAPESEVKRATTPGTPGLAGTQSPENPSTIAPALPALAEYHALSNPFQPPSPHQRTDSVAYYTAAWGSPYATPSRPASRSLTSISPDPVETSIFSMLSGSEPIASNSTNPTSISLATERLSSKTGSGPFGRKLDKNPRKGKSPKESTREWVDQYMSGEPPRTERTNWLSDESGDGELSSSLAAKKHLSEDPDGWLGLDDTPAFEDPLKTPTASSKPLGQKIGGKKTAQPRLSVKHSPNESTETLKQSDFWDFGYDPDAVPATMDDMGPSVTGQLAALANPKPNAAVSPTEKPLPPRPDGSEEDGATPSPVDPVLPSKRVSPEKLQRPKKKVPWKGKQCIIALPLNDVRGLPENGGPILTNAEFEKRLEELNDTDAAGFPDPMDGGSQSCPAYPGPNEYRKEREDRAYTVRFPDKAEWDGYVNELQEQKLRALGVSLGDEEPAPQSAAMSLDSSQIPGKNISPPIPGSSVNSNHLSTAANPFSPAFNQSAQANSTFGSQTSPSSPFGFLANSPFSNQQFAFGHDQDQVGSGQPFLPFQQSTPPMQGNFTPQNLLTSQQGGVSPLNAGALPNLGSLIDPVSPLTAEDVKRFPATSTPPAQGRHPLSSQFQPADYEEEDESASRSLQDRGLGMEGDSETIMSSSVPEMAHPTPRGHRHNLSETLQKGVERAEHELEDTIRRQLEEDESTKADNDLMRSRWAVPEDNELSQQLFHQPDPKSQTENLQHVFAESQNADDGSEIDTNPSLTGASPKPDFSFQNSVEPNAATSHNTTGSTASFGHKSGTSASAFNVGAKAFDPSASFSQNSFSFMGNTFQPPAALNNPAPAFNPSISHGTSNSAHSSGFNVAAQPFTAGSNSNSISSNNKFKFSALSFNVDAPEFNPLGSTKLTPSSRAVSDTKPADDNSEKIFGNFDASQFVRPPPKESKAIPIIRPDEKRVNDDDEGRGREKRSRRGGEDDNQEAVFISPAETLPTPPTVPSSHPLEAKEVDDNNSEKSTVPDESMKPHSPALENEPGSQSTRWEPFEFKIEQDAAAFNDARPVPPTKEENEQEDTTTPDVEQAATPTPEGVASSEKELPPLPEKEEVTASESNSFTLKPTAKPFEFNPAIKAQPLPEPEQPAPPSPPKKSLMASRYAVVSPPSSPKSHPASARSPQEPVTQQRGVESLPSTNDAERHSMDEQELDAVMRKLNDDDSDLGVERRETQEQIASEDHIMHNIPPTPPLQGGEATASPRVNIPRLTTDVDNRSGPVLSPQRSTQVDAQSPVRHLNNPAFDHVSDWDEAFSPGADGELQHRSRFFDTRINDIIGGILEDRLTPLERTLGVIQHSVGLIASSNSPTPRRNLLPTMSASAKESDADDEDEDEQDSAPHRSRSPLDRRERRFERIKQVVLDALASSEASQTATPPVVDLSGVQATLMELKELAAAKPALDQDNELKDAISELKQLAIAKPEQSHSRDFKDAISEVKQFAVSKGEQEQRAELRDAVSELKQLVVARPEQDPSNELKDAISELKQLVAEKPPQNPNDEFKDAISELKHLLVEKPAQDPNDEVKDAITALKHLVIAKPEQDPSSLKDIIADAIWNHPRFNEKRDTGEREGDGENLNGQMDVLQSMLRIADERADDEYKARRKAQDSLAETQRLLRVAEEDVAQHREEAAAAKQQYQEFKDTKLPQMERVQEESALVKEQQRDLHMALSEMQDKNISLRGALDEHKAARDRWLSEADETKAENKDLRRTISTLKQQMDNSMQSRQSLRGKFDRLQQDMITASQDIAKDQSLWRKREEDHIAKYNTLQSYYDREVKQRQKLELHVSDLEQTEKESMKFKFVLQQSQEENSKLEELLMNIRQESHDYQSKAARFERELNDARENTRLEVQKVRTTLESEVDAANHQVNVVRADFESQISTLETRLENSQHVANTANERHELVLEEARESKAAALRDTTESKDLALQEQRLVHERTLNDLRERHARALHNSSEDKHRDESHYMELIALRDEKVDQLQDKVTYLEERVELANSAARAAAQAAQTAKNTPTVKSPTHVASPSMTSSQPSGIPEKISPQALRESIMVLQDQLQQREGRIESLEQELSAVDKEAPTKLKDKETEINWLRELLGVRVDDIQDIINTLSQPSFNQQAVRDAAIRLKANLQMQQQERERAMAGGNQPFPSLGSISNLAASASPRALPLAAAAAWGNWRKARDNTNTLTSSSRTANDNDQTPSRAPSSSQGFLSGLMTPPSSHVRQTPTNQAPPPPLRSAAQSRPLRSSSGSQQSRSIRQGKMPQTMEPPSTPPFLRQSSYDRDAEATNYEDGSYMDDNESLVSGIVTHDSHAGPSDGPFGPAI